MRRGVHVPVLRIEASCDETSLLVLLESIRVVLVHPHGSFEYVFLISIDESIRRCGYRCKELVVVGVGDEEFELVAREDDIVNDERRITRLPRFNFCEAEDSNGVRRGDVSTEEEGDGEKVIVFGALPACASEALDRSVVGGASEL